MYLFLEEAVFLSCIFLFEEAVYPSRVSFLEEAVSLSRTEFCYEAGPFYTCLCILYIRLYFPLTLEELYRYTFFYTATNVHFITDKFYD